MKRLGGVGVPARGTRPPDPGPAPGRKFDLRGARAEFARNLPLVMVEAGTLGLYETMHALHDAVRKVGYELERLRLKGE